MVTLAQEFQEDSYFEAYLRYVDERQWAEDEGRDPEEVEFIPPPDKGECAGVRQLIPWMLRPRLLRRRVIRIVESLTCKPPLFPCSFFFLPHLFS